MKHHDSIAQADKKLTQSIEQLRQWNLAATPINYAVSYEYITGKNQALYSAIKQQIASEKPLDNFFLEEVYREYVLGQSKFRDEIVTDLDDLITQVEKNNRRSSSSANGLINTLDTSINAIQSDDKRKVKIAISKLRKASHQFKAQQEKLADQLKQSQRQASNLRSELEGMRKEIYLDPLTQLYNRKAMNQHLEIWHSENPDRHISALVINLDYFAKFSQRFGPLIGDVLLSKVAKKVSSYVTNSGLPVRSGGDEFLILLPDVDTGIATEIAEKIRQGVEKLRFVSSKSGVRLPPMTVSIGITGFRVTKNINTVIQQARQTLNLKAKHQTNLVIAPGN